MEHFKTLTHATYLGDLAIVDSEAMSTPSDLITCQDIPKMKLGTKTTTKCLVEIACPQLVGLLSVKNSWSSSMMIGFIPTMLDGLMPQSKWIRLALP